MAEGIDFAITAHDKATAVLAKVSNASTAMAKNVSSGFRQMADDIKRESQQAQQATASLGKTMGSFLAGGAIVGGVLALGKAFISANANMETFNLQFETLLGSAEEAKKRMEELAVFAASTPFELDGIAKASKILQTFGGNLLATGDGLRMVGDAAAVAGVPMEELAVWIGRAYDGLSNNRPIGEATMRLSELALISGEARNQIEQLQQAGRGDEAWKVLQNELGRTAGAMEKLSNSWIGVVSTIKDQFAEINRAIGDAGIWEELKEGIMTVRDELQKWIESGDMKKFADQVSGVLKFLWDLKEPIMWLAGAGGLAMLANAFVKFGVAMSANPVGATIVLLGGLAIAIDQVTDAMNRNSEARMTWFDNKDTVQKVQSLWGRYKWENEKLAEMKASMDTFDSEKFKGYSYDEKLAEIERQKQAYNEQKKVVNDLSMSIATLTKVKQESITMTKIGTWTGASLGSAESSTTGGGEQLPTGAGSDTNVGAGVIATEFTAEQIAMIESDKLREEVANQKEQWRNEEFAKASSHWDKLNEQSLEKSAEVIAIDENTLLQQAINQQTARDELLRVQMTDHERKIADTEAYYEKLKEMAEGNAQLQGQIETEKQRQLDQLQQQEINRQVVAQSQKATHFAQLGGQLVDTIEMVAKASGASEAEMKKLRIASVVMNTMMAMGASSASIWSTMGGTWQEKLAENIAIHAMQLTQMGAQIATINKGYEFGGIVNGQSASGDKTAINVNDGEMVVTTAQQAGLWNALQGLSNGAQQVGRSVTNIINIAGNATTETVDYLIERLRVQDTYNRRYQIGGGVA